MRKWFLYGLFVLCLLCRSISPCLSQNTPYPEIRKIYGIRAEGKYERAEKITKTADGHFVMAGTWQDSAWVMKTTACGELLWNKRIPIGQRSSLAGICELPDGRLAAAGFCTHCVHGDSAQKALVMLLDEDGVVLKDTVLGYVNRDANASDITLTLKGEIAITGNVVTDELAEPSEMLLALFDQDIRLLSYAPFRTHYSETGNAIIATRDSGIAVAGFSVDAAGGFSRGQVYKWDATGALVSATWDGRDTFPLTTFNTLAEMPDGSLLAGGSAYVNSILKKEALFTVFSGVDGSVMQRATFGSGYDDEANDLQVIEEGGYLVLGVYGAPRSVGRGKRDWVFQLSDSLLKTERAYYDEYQADHRGKSIVSLSPGAENYALVSVYSAAFKQDAFFVKSKRTGLSTTFTEAPLDFQLYPRDTMDMGHVLISGTAFDTKGEYDSLRVEIFREDSLAATLSQSLTYSGGAAPFAFAYDLPAELANYRFNISGTQGITLYPEAEACAVVAGDAFIITGQSNAYAGNIFGAFDTIPNAHLEHGNEFVRNFGLKYSGDTVYAWHKEKEDDNPVYEARSGEWGLVMADQIADEHGVPVAILNGGINGISIDSMMPDAGDHFNASLSYGRFLRRTVRSGLKDDFRGILFFQGETNTTVLAAETVNSYKAKFAQLNAAWDTDYTGREKNYLFQIRTSNTLGGTLAGSLIIEEAHRQIADEYADYDIMSSTGMYHDGAHFWYYNGYERAGSDIFRLVNRDLYGGPALSNMTPPSYDSVWFSNMAHTQLAIRMRMPGDGLYWYSGWEADFIAEGSPTTFVIGGSIAGNLVLLDLNEAPAAGFTGISYHSHPVGDDCSVKNLNGIGMLCFANAAVGPFVGVEEAEGRKSVRVYPNPSEGDEAILEMVNETGEDFTITFFDPLGVKVREDLYSPAGGSLFHRVKLPAGRGLYLMEVRQGETVSVIRFLKQ